MTKKLSFLSLILLLFSCKNEAQIIIRSQPKKIEFKNLYQFNTSIEEKLNDKSQPWNAQSAYLDYSIKGEFEKVLELDDKGTLKRSDINSDTVKTDSLVAKYSAVDAVNHIVKEARRSKITIINEAHGNPEHRVFTKSLLKKLYDAGYTHLGLETLYNGPKGGTLFNNGARLQDEKDTLLNKRKYAVKTSGVYSKEPQFGNLIRSALEIGFIVFSYEKTGVGSGYPREIGQAKNIKNVLDKNPNSKLLIHCGFDHAYEGTGAFEAEGKAMAGWLKELTDIDPLTIDQVKYSQHSKPEYNEPLLNALKLENSSVLIDTNDNALRFNRNNLFADIAVFHPPTDYANSTPTWLFQEGVKNIELDLSILDINFPIMILAFNEGEPIERAIPVDVVEINNETTFTNLALNSGTYHIVVVNIDGDALKFDIRVK